MITVISGNLDLLLLKNNHMENTYLKDLVLKLRRSQAECFFFQPLFARFYKKSHEFYFLIFLGLIVHVRPWF